MRSYLLGFWYKIGTDLMANPIMGKIMATTSFTIDAKLDQILENLKNHYGATSKAEVLRKAIALLNIVSRNESEDGTLTIRNNKEDIKVILR